MSDNEEVSAVARAIAQADVLTDDIDSDGYECRDYTAMARAAIAVIRGGDC